MSKSVNAIQPDTGTMLNSPPAQLAATRGLTGSRARAHATPDLGYIDEVIKTLCRHRFLANHIPDAAGQVAGQGFVASGLPKTYSPAVAYYEWAQLPPPPNTITGENNGPDEDVRIGAVLQRVEADLFRFLDGDTSEQIQSVFEHRSRQLKDEGLVPGSEAYEQRLRELRRAHRADVLARRVIQGSSKQAKEARAQREPIFGYIIEFWERSTRDLPFGADTGEGKNLALRPFMVPTGSLPNNSYKFEAQYRWDTYFQNLGSIVAGGYGLALGQLKNLVDTGARFGIIPNALTDDFLSHAQPPMEVKMIEDILEYIGPGTWFTTAIRAVEQDLWNNWLDAGSEIKKKKRQQFAINEPIDVMARNYLLTRHVTMHFSKTLVGCEDGKDHYEIPHVYGESYLPVQLNAILHGHFKALQHYYERYQDAHAHPSNEERAIAADRAAQYKQLAAEHKRQFNDVFWEDRPGWQGYRNVALAGNDVDGKEGRIMFDDLSAEVFPLVFGLADKKQANVIRDNIMTHYLGDSGLAATNPVKRKGAVDLGPYITKPHALQWSGANCWPPLIEMAIQGLQHYGYKTDAATIRSRWLAAQETAFSERGYFMEKSSSTATTTTLSSGHYGTITGGFGWTIGVYLRGLHASKG